MPRTLPWGVRHIAALRPQSSPRPTTRHRGPRAIRVLTLSVVACVAPAAAAQAAHPIDGSAQASSATAVAPGGLPGAATPIGAGRVVGVRSTKMALAQQTLGPVKITRHYYDQLPSRYQPLFPGVSEVVSFLHSTPANTAAFVKSIPAGTPVVLVYHHEPEGGPDYPGTPQQGGAKFVAEFNTQAAVVHANSKIPMGFIGGGYQYKKNHRGVGGYFIPSTADYYFMDTYSLNTAIVPATQDLEVQGFLTELRKKGKHFDGFTEYARGTSTGSPSARASVITADNTWLRSMGARVWIYWWDVNKRTKETWRFTDSPSIAAWRKVAAQ